MRSGCAALLVLLASCSGGQPAAEPPPAPGLAPFDEKPAGAPGGPGESPPSAPDERKRSGGCRHEDSTIDKACATVADCVVVTEVVDCCATTNHVGVSKRGRAAFDERPKRDLHCNPGMSCVVRWMRAEDCDDASHGEIELECSSAGPSKPGLCMTRVVPHASP